MSRFSSAELTGFAAMGVVPSQLIPVPEAVVDRASALLAERGLVPPVVYAGVAPLPEGVLGRAALPKGPIVLAPGLPVATAARVLAHEWLHLLYPLWPESRVRQMLRILGPTFNIL